MAIRATTSNGTGVVYNTSTATLRGLQTWTWGFWLKRTSAPATGFRSIINSGPDGIATARDLRLNAAGQVRIVLNGTGTDATFISTNALSTTWQFYAIACTWNATPTVVGYVSDIGTTGNLSTISWGTATNSTGTLNTESVTKVALMNNNGGANGCSEAELGPFCLWNRALTQAQAQQVFHYGPLAQHTGLLAWLEGHYWFDAFGWTVDYINGRIWTGLPAQLTYVSNQPALWAPWRS